MITFMCLRSQSFGGGRLDLQVSMISITWFECLCPLFVVVLLAGEVFTLPQGEIFRTWRRLVPALKLNGAGVLPMSISKMVQNVIKKSSASAGG